MELGRDSVRYVGCDARRDDISQFKLRLVKKFNEYVRFD